MTMFHTIHLIEGKVSRRIHVVWEDTDETAGNFKARSFAARNLEKYVKERRNEGKTKVGK